MGELPVTAKRVILLVEDEALLLEMTRADLEDLGFEVICASNADGALEVLHAGTSISALLTDIRMPGMHDGWELARRARDLRPGLPVLYASGFSANTPQPVPGSIFLQKPYRLPDIEKALEALSVC
jgi:CheY-like chemotaxis protein